MNMRAIVTTGREKFDALLEAYPVHQSEPHRGPEREAIIKDLAAQAEDWQYYQFREGDGFGKSIALSPSLGVSRELVYPEDLELPLMDMDAYASLSGDRPDPLSEEALGLRNDQNDTPDGP